eukprot:1215592-Alexandrium_andersonii.AAC.1
MCIRDRPLEPPPGPNATLVRTMLPSPHAAACSLRPAWWASRRREASAASPRDLYATGSTH